MKLKQTLIALASTTLIATGLAHAADNAPPATAPMAKASGQEMVRPASAGAERSQLQQQLQAGKTRADYEKILKANGYTIAAINEDKKDYLEYEVVKGQSSHEVHIGFKDGAAQASEVEVKPNMWRADTTKAMLKDPNYKQTGAIVADPKGRYSDSRYMKGWTDEKERLEKALPLKLKATDYRSRLEGMGYKVTAVNDQEKDYVEYEIAKGDNSYEVKIDLDPSSGMAKEIDVTSNLWEADATDKATDRAAEMKK
jgi:ribosomal protein S6